METFEETLKRYITAGELELLGWGTISMQNFFLRELRIAAENRLSMFIILGTHAVIQKFSDKLFGLKPKEGTKFYLEHFVDGSDPDKKFSLVSDELHQLRNVMAHRWSSKNGIWFDYEMPEGWKREQGVLSLNPRIYAEQFAKAFESGHQVQLYMKMISDEEKVRKQYQLILDYLDLDRNHAIAQEIKKLESCSTMQDIRKQEAVIRQMICKEYNLT